MQFNVFDPLHVVIKQGFMESVKYRMLLSTVACNSWTYLWSSVYKILCTTILDFYAIVIMLALNVKMTVSSHVAVCKR